MKNIYIIALLICFTNLKAQVGINVENPDIQSVLDVESLFIRGNLINPNPNGSENQYYRILANGYPGWEDLPQPIDFTGSVMIKDKMIMESTTGISIRNISEANADNHLSSLSDKSWVLMPDLKTTIKFDKPNGGVNAQFQTMALKYTDTGNTNNNNVSFTCGFFIRKTPSTNQNSTTGYKLKTIRPEVIIGNRNTFKVFSVSGVIDTDDTGTSFIINQSYDLAVACRGRTVQSDETLRIGKTTSGDNTNRYDTTTTNLLTPTNVKSTFIVEQYETP